MYELLCDYFGADAVNIFCFLVLSALIIAWRIAVFFESNPKFSLRSSFRKSVFSIGTSLGLFFGLWCAYAQQKEEQQIAQRQIVIELFTSINEVVVSMGETAISGLRTYLTPEEKKSRLLPVGLATNNLAWVSESQCVTSQVREAWQRVPIRRAAFRQSLPFPVIVGSNSYEEVFISSSGIIGFDALKGSELTREIPYEEAADHVYLALLWGRIDFKPRLGSKMWYGVKEDGNFVASYDTVFIDGDTNAVAKVQIEFINNGDMILRYGDLPPCATNAHTAGFQNLDGGWTLSPDNIRSNTAIYLKAFGTLDLSVQDSDTDGDGISDYYELYPTNAVSITDPCNIDTDGDGLMDREEIFTFGTDPGAFSTDGGGTGDLWRVSGGFSPSDAPYTNAPPSGTSGILTITTLLENAGANGGAVLRIADQYIPVLAGTTLVSRIAVPRGATNIFILARGVNCDNAVAHVTAEASSFTKIRDPSSVFSGSFTLSPSCVTASGTIIMPAYTITPAVLCYHSPTSSTCRITSADPDVYFWTTQGFVREFTPEAPYIPPNTFSNGTLQVSLVSMDMALSTLASVTNIPVHLCNPYSGGTNDYPDAPEYDDWCKLVDGEHVWAPGFNATNCPCVLAYTNAYECLCSRDGQKPCACLHGTCDPRAMPQDGSPTNVLGHAALIIGGTNDLLEVEVPGGSLRPCPLCACGLGFSSSASVYRHTSCINATPGSLATNGVFSVTGVHPSTNFADSVFIYKITDCSGSQTVTSYTRKDYTVLGTAVYPTDTGHSVSNWFISCNITNELTLWTGVALPADSGAVSLSVTNESGAPSPQLYVYNRIAQTNELLITPEQLTFTQSLGIWRNTYCDTNGYVKAYLTCASGGIARVIYSFNTYPSTSHEVSCSSEQALGAVQITFEPLTTENEPTVYNPSGIATNDIGVFKIEVLPENLISDNAITWTIRHGDLSFINNNNHGRLIQVRAGSTTNEFKLEIDIQNLNLTNKPYIEGKVLLPTIIPAYVWIVRKTDGSYPAASSYDVSNRLISANLLLKQVGMKVAIREINYTNDTDLLTITYTNGIFQGAETLRSITNNTDGIELYFVKEIVRGENEMILGIENEAGIILSSSYLSNYQVMAHEILHTCGLLDIYINENGLAVTGVATIDRLPSDWGGGYYASGSILQETLIKRNLMSGYLEEGSSDIPLGSVYGVWYEGGSGEKIEEEDLEILIWQIDLAPIGLNNLVTRQPTHQ